jgi:uncharacterized membrane protein
MDATKGARALGWFSIGFGLTEVAIAKRLSAYLGMEDRAGLVRGFGFRELATGAGVLAQRNPAPGIWARVAGDVLDLATLGSGLTKASGKRKRVVAATGAIVGITLLDVVCARQLSRNGGHAGAATDAVEVQRSLTIGQPLDDVYRRWREPQTLPRIMEQLADVTPTDERHARWTVRGPLGRTLTWDTHVVEDRPNELMRWQSLPGADLAHEGSVRFRPAPGDLGTVVTLRLRFDPPGGPLGAAMKLTNVVPKMAVGNALRRFKSLVETGEIPTLDRNPSARGSGDAV